MLTETITWLPVAQQLPDAETNVLLTVAGDEPGTCEGFLDGEEGGALVWRDVTAAQIAGPVTHWAAMPKGATAPAVDAEGHALRMRLGTAVHMTAQELGMPVEHAAGVPSKFPDPADGWVDATGAAGVNSPDGEQR